VQEFLFRGIQKSEWTNLFSFIQSKRLRIDNLAEAEQGPGGGGRMLDLDLGEDIDNGLAAMGADSDSEDESFQVGAGMEKGAWRQADGQADTWTERKEGWPGVTDRKDECPGSVLAAATWGEGG
jgi:structure-specific recognition protein 1